MSAIKYQLQALLPSLVSQARGNSDPEIKKRFKFLKAVGESTSDVRRACRREGESHQAFYKWAKILLRTKNIASLKPKSRRPKRSPNQTPKRIEQRIKKIRELMPFQGGERISQDLKDMFNLKCPPSTVNAVLKRQGFIGKEESKRLTKKHMKRYRRPMPGYLQMDFKYVPYLIEGQQYYQLSCVDHHSSWRLIRNYRRKTEFAVIEFLNLLIDVCPFPIVQIQTDNDAAFTDKFTSGTLEPTGKHLMDRWCKKYEIEHKLIPIGQKELNGKVENTHKFDDREYFSQIHCLNFASLQLQTCAYNDRWNEQRKTKALGWKTPWEVVLDSYVRSLAYLTFMGARLNGTSECTHSEVYQGRRELSLEDKTASAAVVKTKPKRLTAVDRYLQYVDWEDRQRLKSIIPAVAMSQIFSFYRRSLQMGNSRSDVRVRKF